MAAGIATSNGRAMVDAVLDSLEIGEYFKVVATACEVAAGKPAPDIYLNVAERLGVPEDCVVFEDVPAGIQAGKRAGMTVFAVEDEFFRDWKAEKKSWQTILSVIITNYRMERHDETRLFAHEPGGYEHPRLEPV